MKFFKKNISTSAIKFLIVIYIFLPVFQSGDLTDTGYLAVNYNWFFQDYLNCKVNSAMIFTEFLGAVWLMIFGSLGILGLRFYNAFTVLITVILIYTMYKRKYGNENVILLAIFSGLCYFGRWDIRVFSYDTLTLFLIVLILFLDEIYTHSWWIFYALVVFLYALILTKITNVFFVAIFVLYKLLNERTKHRNFLYTFILVSGLFLIVSWKSGFLQNYLYGLLSSNSGNSYSFYKLLQLYVADFRSFLPYLLLTLITIGTIMFKSVGTRIFYATLMLLAILLFYYFFEDYGYSASVKYLYPAILMVYFLIILSHKRTINKEFILIISAAGTLFLGSGTGVFLKLGYASVFLAPFVFGELTRLKNVDLKIQSFTFFFKFVIFFFIILGIWLTHCYIYKIGAGITIRKTAVESIGHSKMVGVLTTPQIANEIKRTSKFIEDNTSIDKPLFLFGHKPLFYYLTSRKPLLKRFWLTNGVWRRSELFDELQRFINEEDIYPVICDMQDGVFGDKGKRDMEVFLFNNGYNQRISSDYCTIWKKI